MNPEPKPGRVDKHGRPVKVGDTIRVRGIPPDVRNCRGNPADKEELKTKTVFARCLDRTIRLKDLDGDRD